MPNDKGQQIFAVLVDLFGKEKAGLIWQRTADFDLKDRVDMIQACIAEYAGIEDRGLNHYHRWKTKSGPVDPLTFLHSPAYMAIPENEVWPVVRDAVIDINSGEYIEAVLTGAIGTAKTTVALLTQAYQLYLLSLYSNPHYELGLMPTDEILFIFQNMSASLSKAVDYARFKEMIDRAPYFNRHFMYDRGLKSEMHFPRRIIVKPLSGQMTAAIGQNVFSGVLDELNFMAVVEKSKQTHDGKTFDQAAAIYNTINMRRKSRFMNKGYLPGIVCMVSSRNYPGQFTDRKEDERLDDIKRYGKSPIYLYDKVLWDVKPQDFGETRFPVFLGTTTQNPRILKAQEVPKLSESDAERVMLIPTEFSKEFSADLMGAIRDIAGQSTMAKHPYFQNAELVSSCIGQRHSIFSRSDVDFEERQLQIIKNKIERADAEFYPRWVHLDLALSGDAAGLCIMHVPEFANVERGDGTIERLPKFCVDGLLRVEHAPGREINLEKVRRVIYLLSKLGMPIKWVSADQFQSADTLQILANEGYMVGRVSVDSQIEPYAWTKKAFYDQRIEVPDSDVLRKELLSLEYDAPKQKVDHPPNGSKDVSDALAGCVYGLTMSREIWAIHGVTPGIGLLNQLEVEKEKRAREQ
ncbi:MAG: hypothetical protein QNJ97_29410, partial [Myxococcota bacterium]|nr:hypothetical protein [Myxococcota bacterium]